MVFIVRKKLSADEVTPPGTRYNADCNCIQQSPDGGTTWNDAPGIDPRSNPGGLLPPLSSDDPQCDAAWAMSNRVKQVVDAFLNTGNLAGAASAIFAALIFILPGLGLLVGAILIAVDLFLALGAIEIAAAMTEDTYAQLANIFFCHIGTDGQMTQDGYAAMYADVESQFTDPAIGIIERVLDIVGFVGLSNAGANATEPGDCSGFECAWCYEWSNTTDMASDGWGLAINTASSKYWAYSAATLHITDVISAWTTTGDASDPASAWSIWRIGNSGGFDPGDLIQQNSPLDTDPSPTSWTGDEICSQFTIGVNTPSGTTELTALHLAGIGTRPAWTHGTEC